MEIISYIAAFVLGIFAAEFVRNILWKRKIMKLIKNCKVEIEEVEPSTPSQPGVQRPPTPPID